MLDEENVLSKDLTRFRKFNLRRQAYLIALKEASIDEKQAYYESFVILMKKKKRFHRDELSSESKYYQQMLKHSEVSDFLRIMNIEIQALQAKNIWKIVSYQHAKDAERASILII